LSQNTYSPGQDTLAVCDNTGNAGQSPAFWTTGESIRSTSGNCPRVRATCAANLPVGLQL
jgi:hypothetical protein